MSIWFGEAYNWLLKTAMCNFTATLIPGLMPTRFLVTQRGKKRNEKKKNQPDTKNCIRMI